MSAQTKTSSLANFVPLGKLGTGSFSSVYKVRRLEDNTIYALKKMKLLALKQKEIQNALNEISILSSLSCQNIISYKEAFYDEKLNLLCLVMELANQGDLSKKIDQYKNKNTLFSQQQVWTMLRDIVIGLKTLHSHSILHRDLKSANIFISDKTYKLGDMNVSKIQQSAGKLAYTQTGTPNYASPEVWRDQPYDNKSDIWSLGCVAYEMCSYKPPFKGKNLDQLYKCVQRGYYQPLSSKYSENLKNFISLCLKHNSYDRPSCQKLLELIEASSNNIVGNDFDETSFSKNQTICDIKMPKTLKEFNKCLPKPNYCSQKQINIKSENNLISKYQIKSQIKNQIKSQIKSQIKRQANQLSKQRQDITKVQTQMKNSLLKIELLQDGIKCSNRLLNPSKGLDNCLSAKKLKDLQQNSQRSSMDKLQKYILNTKRPYERPYIREVRSMRQISLKHSQDLNKVAACLSQRKRYSIDLLNKGKQSCTDRAKIADRGTDRDRAIYLNELIEKNRQQKRYLKNINSMKYIKKIEIVPKRVNISIPQILKKYSYENPQLNNIGNQEVCCPISYLRNDALNSKLKKISSTPNICQMMVKNRQDKKDFSYLNQKSNGKKHLLLKR